MASSIPKYVSYLPFSYHLGGAKLEASPQPSANPAASSASNVSAAAKPPISAAGNAAPSAAALKERRELVEAQLKKIREELIGKLDYSLHKDRSERLNREGSWEKTMLDYNDLIAIDQQIKILQAAKLGSLSKEDAEKQTKIDEKEQKKIDEKIKKYTETLTSLALKFHKNFSAEAPLNKTLDSLLSSPNKIEDLKNWGENFGRYLALLLILSQGTTVVASSKALSEYVHSISFPLGVAASIAENVAIYGSHYTFYASPVLAGWMAFSPEMKQSILRAINGPKNYLCDELSNLKDAAKDAGQLGVDTAKFTIGHSLQAGILTIGGTALLKGARILADTEAVSSSMRYFSPETGLVAKAMEKVVVAADDYMGWNAAIGTSFLASIALIDNPDIKKPSTENIRHTLPKAATFIRNAALATTAVALLTAAISDPGFVVNGGANITSQACLEVAKRTFLWGAAIFATQKTVQTASNIKDHAWKVLSGVGGFIFSNKTKGKSTDASSNPPVVNNASSNPSAVIDSDDDGAGLPPERSSQVPSSSGSSSSSVRKEENVQPSSSKEAPQKSKNSGWNPVLSKNQRRKRARRY